MPQRLQVLETAGLILVGSSIVLSLIYDVIALTIVRSLFTLAFVPLAVLTLLWARVMREELEKVGLLEDLPPDAPDPNQNLAYLFIITAVANRELFVKTAHMFFI